jgi:hypothetical protein
MDRRVALFELRKCERNGMEAPDLKGTSLCQQRLIREKFLDFSQESRFPVCDSTLASFRAFYGG